MAPVLQDTYRPTEHSYDAAVEEALCFGWIDSIVKRVDDTRYLRKFTPRSNTGKWSALNLKRVRRLIESGRMTELGLAKLDRGVQPEIPPARKVLAVPRFFQHALARNTRARENFARLAPSYRRNFVGWVSAAKKDETRQRRLREAIGLLERGERLGLK